MAAKGYFKTVTLSQKMETVIVRLKNNKAKKILNDLAELDLIELQESKDEVEASSSGITDLKEHILRKMSEEEINQQLEALREEWQRDI